MSHVRTVENTHITYVTNQQTYSNKIYFILSYTFITLHYSVLLFYIIIIISSSSSSSSSSSIIIQYSFLFIGTFRPLLRPKSGYDMI